VRALLAFFTALPIEASGSSLEDAARRTYLLPLVGLLAGLPGAALLLLANDVLPPGVAATLALGAVLLATGLHHTDGVLDVGDAFMVQGSPERRREVLKDDRVGAGAIGALFVVYAPTLAALAALNVSPVRAASALLASEVTARSAMLLLLVFGRPAEEGSSSVPFVRSLKEGSRRVAALSFALALPPLVALPLGWYALLLALAAPAATTSFALALAKRAFGGLSGDVVGATGELARAVLLVALSAI